MAEMLSAKIDHGSFCTLVAIVSCDSPVDGLPEGVALQA